MLIKLNDNVFYNQTLNALEVASDTEGLRIANNIITQCILYEGHDSAHDAGVMEEEEHSNLNPVWPGRRKNLHANL